MIRRIALALGSLFLFFVFLLVISVGFFVYLDPFPASAMLTRSQTTSLPTINDGSLADTPVVSNPSSEWRTYAHDGFSSRHFASSLITAKNAPRLHIAWTWDNVDRDLMEALNLKTQRYEATPLMANGRLFTSTALNQVVALNPLNGKLIWLYDPKTYLNGYPAAPGFVHRGVSYWQNGKQKARIFTGTNDGHLISLDAQTGLPDPQFGDHGRIDLTQGLRRPIERALYSLTSPPAICGDIVIAGSAVSDFAVRGTHPPGDVRGFDVQTGKPLWTFHTIPTEHEFGAESWLNSSWQTTGHANVWAPMSVDQDLGAVFLPVSTPDNDFYGGARPGNGLFGDSIVSLDCKTGKRFWHFQLVHHGLWDYDPPAAPLLMNLQLDHKNTKAVVQITKQAFAFSFDRTNGAPLWPIVERAVPQSETPGEHSSPTQPMPTKPPPFDRQVLNDETLVDFTPELRANAKRILQKYKYEGLFTPPSRQGSLILPGTFGGANWSSGSFDPATQTLFISSTTQPSLVRLAPGWWVLSSYEFFRALFLPTWPESPGPKIPLTKPPYGRITAIDMKNGTIKWIIPIGTGPKNELAQMKVSIPAEQNLGWSRRTHLLSTPQILFAAQEGPSAGNVAPHFRWAGHSLELNSYTNDLLNDEPTLLAIDPRDGKIITQIQLPGNASGSPMTYIANGRQFILVPIGGAALPTGLVALSL